MMFPFANEICMDDHLFLEARVDQRWSKCPTLSSSYSGGMEGRSSALLLPYCRRILLTIAPVKMFLTQHDGRVSEYHVR